MPPALRVVMTSLFLKFVAQVLLDNVPIVQAEKIEMFF